MKDPMHLKDIALSDRIDELEQRLAEVESANNELRSLLTLISTEYKAFSAIYALKDMTSHSRTHCRQLWLANNTRRSIAVQGVRLGRASSGSLATPTDWGRLWIKEWNREAVSREWYDLEVDLRLTPEVPPPSL